MTASAILSIGVLLLASCGTESAQPAAVQAPAPVELTEAESWSLADPNDDPFSDYASGRVRCTKADFRPEATWLEVTTTQCNYGSFVATFASPAAAGSVIRGEVAWATLAAIDPAVGTLAFATHSGVLWTHDVAIPGLSNLIEIEFTLPEAMPVGASLFFQVRNHGYNSWQLSPLTLGNP
jgi:hypothetical protein